MQNLKMERDYCPKLVETLLKIILLAKTIQTGTNLVSLIL